MQTKQCNAATLQSMCLAASLALFLAGAVSALEIPSGGSTLLNLDTTAPDPELTLAGSTVLGWGPFSLMKTNNLPPTLGTFNGVSAVRFYDTGDSHLRSDADAPGTVTGGNAWTIEAWAYTTNLWSLSVLLSWGNDLAANGHSATLSYGNDAAQGAVRHTGDNAFNLGYIGLSGNAPAQGEWHHLAVTYSGAADGQRREHLYVDGVLIAGQNNLALNVEAGTRFHLGTLFRPVGRHLHPTLQRHTRARPAPFWRAVGIPGRGQLQRGIRPLRTRRARSLPQRL